MDVMSPQLMWIGGRCYRINQTYQEEPMKKSEGTPYTEEDLYDDEDLEDFEIEPTDNDRFKTSYHIPQIFFSHIIGSKGATKKRIEAETKTQIRIPRPGVEGDVVIIGPTRQTVASARRKVDLIVLAARSKQQFTHFLCVPFMNKDIKEAFIKFRDEILNGPEIPGLEASLFQDPNKLHLTISVLSLMDNEDRALAAQILQECRETIIQPVLQQYGPISLRMKGLEYMNDDPSSVDILYGKVESEPMQIICDAFSNRFAEKGFKGSRKKTESVKMHVTLINSKFRDEFRENNKKQQTEKFDARKILESYGNFEFGTQFVTEIHLSQLHSTSCDGFYEATGILKL